MSRRIDPGHAGKRTALRVAGVLVLIAGVALIAVGAGSLFVAGPSPLFFCAFAGMPLLFVGSAMCMFGFMGAVARYQAGEAAPVAKDTFNYLADGTQEGVRTVASAIGEGLRQGASSEGDPDGVRCAECDALNAEDANFCDACGARLQKEKKCSACHEANDADAKYCDNCGQAIG
ncbi:MAG: hypothetical protein GY851_00010 [bacterium]|nr:hypothetical protein [bacterium]